MASWLLLALTGVGRGVYVQQRLLAEDLAHDRAVGARLLADAKTMGLPAALTRIHTTFKGHPPWMRVRSPAGEAGSPPPRGPSAAGLSLTGPREERVPDPPRLVLRGTDAVGDPVLVVQPLFVVPVQVDPLPMSLAALLALSGLVWRRRGSWLLVLASGMALVLLWPGPGQVGTGEPDYPGRLASYIGQATPGHGGSTARSPRGDGR